MKIQHLIPILFLAAFCTVSAQTGIVTNDVSSFNMGHFQQTQNTSFTNNDNSMAFTNSTDVKTRASQLVQDGKQLYEMGKFDEARGKLYQALKLDPDNQGAYYYLNLINQTNYTRAEHNRTNQAQDSIMEVPKTWSPKTNNYIHHGPSREFIFPKLISIRLESISWSNGLPLSDVIRYLEEQSRLRDPDKRGINFMFSPNTATGAAAGASNLIDPNTGLPVTAATNAVPEAVDPNTIKIKLVMNDVSLLEALDAVVRVANRPIKYSVEDYGVVISPKPAEPEPPKLETRVFRMDPNIFYEAMEGVKSQDGREFFNAIGINLSTGGRSVAFDDRLGHLFVKATPSELDTIERVIQVLNETGPHIHIKARFVEVLIPEGGFHSGPLFNVSNTVTGQMTGILSDSQFRVMLSALKQRNGFESHAEPEVTTLSGRQVQMRATEIINVITNYALEDNSHKPAIVPKIGTFETGPRVDLVPHVLADGYTINLTAIAELQQFLGYDSATNIVRSTNNLGVGVFTPTVRPGFRVHEGRATVNMWDGQTLVLGTLKSDFIGGDGAHGNESKFLQDAEKKSGNAGKGLLVFITATIVDPAGNRVHSDDELPFNLNTVPSQPKNPTSSP